MTPTEIARSLDPEEWSELATADLYDRSGKDPSVVFHLPDELYPLAFVNLIGRGLLHSEGPDKVTDLGRAVLAARETADTDPCPPPEVDESGLYEANPVPVNGGKP